MTCGAEWLVVVQSSLTSSHGSDESEHRGSPVLDLCLSQPLGVRHHRVVLIGDDLRRHTTPHRAQHECIASVCHLCISVYVMCVYAPLSFGLIHICTLYQRYHTHTPHRDMRIYCLPLRCYRSQRGPRPCSRSPGPHQPCRRGQRASLCVHIHIHIHTHSHTYTDTYTHAHTDAHTHMWHTPEKRTPHNNTSYTT